MKINKWLLGIGVFLCVFAISFGPAVLGMLLNRNISDIPDLQRTLSSFRMVVFIMGVVIIAHPLYLNLLRKNWKELLLFVFVIFLCMVLAEGALSFVNHLKLQRETNSTSMEFSITVKHNSDGYRDDPFVRSKRVSRILLLGDSYVYGVSVNKSQTFEDILENDLNARSPTEIYNLGKAGTGPKQYLETYERFQNYNHNFVLLSLYVDNDIENYDAEKDAYANAFNLVDSLTFPRVRSALVALFPRKDVCDTYFHEGSLSIEYYQACKDKQFNAGIIDKYRTFARKDYNEYYDALAEQFTTRTATRAHLLETKLLAAQHNVPFAIVIVPSKYQVSTNGFDVLAKLGFHSSKNITQNRKIQDAILAWCNATQTTCIDLLPKMKNDTQSYYVIDDHLNAHGNEKVATILNGSFVLENGKWTIQSDFK